MMLKLNLINSTFLFPERYSFNIDEEELLILRSKFSTSSLDKNSYGGRRYAPRFFTEQDIYVGNHFKIKSSY